MKALFSPFTLYLPYNLLMYQVRKSVVLLNTCKTIAYDKAIHDFRRQNPSASEEDVMKHVLKHKVPASVAGSPAWFRKNLKDLLCQVDHWGLPSFFLMLTADEHTPTRWDEVGDLESFLHRFNQSASWKDAPVECLKLFHSRLRRFMKDFILDSTNAIVGKVLHYVTRYEMQSRGSPYAHIILWVDSADVERVTDEICAFVPGVFDPESRTFQRFADPLLDLLQTYVRKKQLHRCLDDVCRIDGKPCKYGFSWPEHSGPKSAFWAEKMRWIYYRHSYEDRNVVPYQPLILILWGAHMNFQRVTADAWSHYLLKYAFKCEPAGSLNLDLEAAKSLGLHGLTHTQMRAVSAFCLTKPMSPYEAAMASMELSIVDRSSSVVTIDSAPPDCRSKIVMPGSAFRVLIHTIAKYCARPSSLEDVTFYIYFQEFVLTREEKRSGSLLGMDGFGNLVYARLATDSLVRFSDFHPAHQIEGYFSNVLLQKYPFRFEADLLSPENSSRLYFVECQLRGFINDEADIETHLQSYAERHLIASEQRQQLLNKIVQKHPLQPGEFDPLVGRSRVRARGRATHVDVGSVQDVVGCASVPASLDSFSLNTEQQRLVQEIQRRPTGLYIISGPPSCGKFYLLRYLHHLQSYAERHLIASEQRQQLLNKIVQKHPLQPGEFDPLVGRSRVRARGRATHVDVGSVQDVVGCASVPASLDSFSLNTEQQRLVQEIQRRPTGLYIISGPPSCGKFYLLRYLHAWLASKGKNVVLFASTGAAAARLGSGAMTAQRRFSIRANSTYLAPLYPGSFAHDILLGAHAFLGDEFLMMDCSLLDLIVFRLQQVTKMRNPLEHKLLILFGDHAQLPAVCRHDTAGDRVCEKCHINRSMLWMSGVCLGLTVSMRQDDPDFLSFLCIIRHQRPTQEEIDGCQGPCFVGRSAAMAELDAGTTVLGSHREQVVDYKNFVAACVFPEPGQLQNVSKHSSTGSLTTTFTSFRPLLLVRRLS
jgi:predicted ATPase